MTIEFPSDWHIMDHEVLKATEKVTRSISSNKNQAHTDDTKRSDKDESVFMVTEHPFGTIAPFNLSISFTYNDIGGIHKRDVFLKNDKA